MSANQNAPYYFVPEPSKWPLFGSIAAVFLTFGASGTVNQQATGPWLLLVGFLMLFYTLYGWFANVAAESESGTYNELVGVSFRWSMSWFIFSEVMFFAAFFGALFYARAISMPWLGEPTSKALLWPEFTAVWPNLGPAGTIEQFQTIGPWPIPTINTLLLLTSGVTLTISHHALRASERGKAIFWLFATVVLGAVFLGFQAFEYMHAYQDLNLKLSSGIFGSTFFMLTGFHGFHVFLGGLMLTVVLIRMMRGHFTAENHFAFEGAAWYWHFVDVVWLLLYIIVYWM
ncbi:MAG: cytochrome c oxidase subunit 3 [Betaproteobacteria bacterium]|jgi:cytochrome c oxidase subunit 3|nr:cytochrome c oxidase subunit 3 [Pseudomonadota bacterium]NBO03505.1 cytochrome c oxidase subunit 3 [Betaproteobacteria bacterium]HAB47099.1 cytochrome c oxidase subunit 3 [Lautropia sp.]NBO95870.1 cytochrome c oxidase subunit 3 [Betaproteobacteria bacterium]NBP34386.1 cytochrome c oxidase subunit 3 [Betaproteobacteria bacterium]